MKQYHCPTCGRFLFETDAPPGYRVRVPKCAQCKQGQMLRTGQDTTPRPSQVARASGVC